MNTDIGLGDYPQRARRWLAALDEETLRRNQSKAWQAIADAAIALTGLVFLGWSPFPMLLFMVFSLWLGLFEMLGEWVVDRARLERRLAEAQEVEEARRIARELRDGQSRTQGQSLSLPSVLDRVGMQLAVTFYFVGAYTASLIYQLADTVGLSLWAQLVERPDMMLLMGGMIVLRVFGAARRLRAPPSDSDWLGTATPLLEVILFPMLVGFWMILSAVAVQLTEIHGGDPQYVSAAVFVSLGYALIVFRAVVNVRDLPVMKSDLEWLAAKASAPDRQPP
jgi:hypothetical protein